MCSPPCLHYRSSLSRHNAELSACQDAKNKALFCRGVWQQADIVKGVDLHMRHSIEDP